MTFALGVTVLIIGAIIVLYVIGKLLIDSFNSILDDDAD